MKQKLFSVSIADCRVDTFCTGGHGGQNQNAKQMGVRITHPPSGAVGECREERHQHVNKARAFTRMATSKKFVDWVRRLAAQMQTGKSVDDLVDEAMDVKNLHVEVKDEDGRWTPEMKLVS
jgi:protein subunit release factor A